VVYLPSGARWVSYWGGQCFDGGQTVRLPAPWEQPVMLVREGGVIALNVAEQHFGQRADRRAFMVVPVAGVGEAIGGCVEDDGESEAWRDGSYGRWEIRAASDAHSVTLSVTYEGAMHEEPPESVEIHLPASETRQVLAPRARIVRRATAGGWLQLTLQLRA
jgi:alpha-glucosidase